MFFKPPYAFFVLLIDDGNFDDIQTPVDAFDLSLNAIHSPFKAIHSPFKAIHSPFKSIHSIFQPVHSFFKSAHTSTEIRPHRVDVLENDAEGDRFICHGNADNPRLDVGKQWTLNVRVCLVSLISEGMRKNRFQNSMEQCTLLPMQRRERMELFVDELWSWYVRHKRALPWRDLPDSDPTVRAYKILVSEVMLQQTQVSRVIGAYKRFLSEFPTLISLASASNRDVLVAWQGMGYNSRALRLRDSAQAVVERHDGIFPSSIEELLALPGLGRYTAGAVRTFAFRLPTACVDTNIRRVLHRTFAGSEASDGTWVKDDAWITGVCDETLQAWLARGHLGEDFLAALMDFGSLVHTKRNPAWDVCPMTAAGIMVCTPAAWRRAQAAPVRRKAKQEPGRHIGGRFVPNRIIRGRIVQELREAKHGLTLNELGRRVCIDWSADDHRAWMSGLLEKLETDAMIVRAAQRFTLSA